MTIDKTVKEEFTNPGATINYTVIIKNTGSKVALSVVLKDSLAEGFTFADSGLATKEWQLGDINPGFDATVSYQVKVGQEVKPGNYVNLAEASASNASLVSDYTSIEVRSPIVKGEEILPREVLPKTGANLPLPIILGLISGLLMVGILGLSGFFSRKLAQLIFFGSLIVTSLMLAVYFFWPLVSYQLVASVEQPTGEITQTSSPAENQPEIQTNTLIIPKIGVKMPIVEGESEKEGLDAGAWHLPETSDPVLGGNMVLAGHRFKYRPPSEKTFYLLDKLEKDDLVLIFWQGKEYQYKVVSSEVVEPNDTEILKDTLKPTLTLITCHPLFSDKQRLVVRAELGG